MNRWSSPLTSNCQWAILMPFNYPDPALVKLEVLDASDADKEKIRAQNAISWLRL